MASLARQLDQVGLFVRQDLLDRHRSNVLGMAWLFIQPLTYILLFATVFSHLMQSRLGHMPGQYAYSIYLITGVLIWTAFANMLGQLSSIYNSKAGLISKIHLSLGLMPLHVLIVELALYGISMVFFVVFLLLIGHPIGLPWLVLPLVVLLVLGFGYALGLILGMLNVFVPDIKNVTAILLQFGFWMTPIVYLVDILPPWARAWLQFNPVFWAIDAAHDIVFWGRFPSVEALASLAAVTGVFCLIAWWMERSLERDIRDML